VFGSDTLDASGQATLSTSALSVGTHSITAVFAGNAQFAGSTSTPPLSHTVDQAFTTTTIDSVNPISPTVVGEPVVVNFTVVPSGAGSGTPTGNVTVSDGTGATCVGSVASAGSCILIPTTAGPKTLTATYAGDGNFNGSGGSATHNVSATPTDLSVTKADSPDPVNVGENVTYVINVTNHGPESTDVTLTETLPPEVTFVSLTPPSGWTCTTPPVGSTGTLTCSKSMATLEGGTFIVVVRVPITVRTGLLQNTAGVSGTRPDSDTSNNTFTEETAVIQKGDVNGDDVIDLLDVRLCAQIAQGYVTGTAAQRAAADVDDDGDVDADDARILAEFIIGIRTTLP